MVHPRLLYFSGVGLLHPLSQFLSSCTPRDPRHWGSQPQRAPPSEVEFQGGSAKTTEHVCPEPRRSVTIRTASMHLRTGAWGKKSIAKLPNLSKCAEATLLTLPSPKGETPPREKGIRHRPVRNASVNRSNPCVSHPPMYRVKVSRRCSISPFAQIDGRLGEWLS